MNDIVEAKPTELSTFEQKLVEEGKKLAQAAVTLPRISTRNGRFTFPDGHVEPAPMQRVILAGAIIKTLWNVDYNQRQEQEVESGIICQAVSDSALDRYHMRPFANASAPPATHCSDCPENRWEEDKRTGKRRKVGRCTDGFRFIVMDPELVDRDIYILDMSAMGVTEACKLMHAMKKTYSPHPIKGIAEFNFVPTPRGVDRVSVKDAGKPNPHYSEHGEMFDLAQAMVAAEPRWFQPEKAVEGTVLESDASALEEADTPSRSSV